MTAPMVRQPREQPVPCARCGLRRGRDGVLVPRSWTWALDRDCGAHNKPAAA